MIRAIWPGAAAAAASMALAGCSSVGALTGAVAGAASGGGSVNPAVGYAVGIGTKAATDALVQYISRKRQGAEQDEIAMAVDALPVGGSTPWRIRHKVPLFDNEQGEATVVRSIPSALTLCKEVVFTVQAKPPPALPKGVYATTVCQHGTVWKWAGAEPATPRWGFLQ